jgi:hypothetical protein
MVIHPQHRLDRHRVCHVLASVQVDGAMDGLGPGAVIADQPVKFAGVGIQFDMVESRLAVELGGLGLRQRGEVVDVLLQ